MKQPSRDESTVSNDADTVNILDPGLSGLPTSLKIRLLKYCLERAKESLKWRDTTSAETYLRQYFEIRHAILCKDPNLESWLIGFAGMDLASLGESGA